MVAFARRGICVRESKGVTDVDTATILTRELPMSGIVNESRTPLFETSLIFAPGTVPPALIAYAIAVLMYPNCALTEGTDEADWTIQ